MKNLLTALSFLIVTTASVAQDSTAQVQRTAGSPYTTRFWTDGPILVGSIGLTALGTKLVANKKDLTLAELAAINKSDIPAFDRGNAGYYSEKADDISYLPFWGSFALPVVTALIDKDQRKNFGQVMVMYTETMAITGALFTITAGTVNRPRPLVYNDKVDTKIRTSNNNQRSFFAGHTAATAAATFFWAKVFADFHPDSKAKPFVWAAAAVVPAVVGYYRYEAGMHFLSDNLLGYAIGAGVGILVPHLHKKKVLNNKVSLSPQYGMDYKGLALRYKL